MTAKKILRLFIFGTTFFFYLSCGKETNHNRNKKYLDGEFWRQQGLIQIIPFWQSHVRDTAYGAFYMYLSRDGKPLPPWDKHPAMISRHVFGFTTAYLLSGNEKYLETASEGVNYLLKYAWDNKYGGWFDVIERMQPYKPQDTSSVSWWIQSYGLFLPLHLYNIKGEKQYLDSYQKMASFWNNYFVDGEFGGVFQNISTDGVPVNTNKAVVWKASYHEMENAFLNYLYLNLYVNHKPVTLYFHIKNASAQSKHFVSIVENSSVQIRGVKINGKSWYDFDDVERYIILPEGKNLKIEVTLVNNSKD